jgi:hypothetical protein
MSLHPSDTSMETEPLPQDVSQEPEPRIPDGENPDPSADDPATSPELSAADIPPEPSRYVSTDLTYYSGLALRLAQNRAMHHWLGPRYPDRALSAKRLRTFRHAKWSTEGKPSREALADAGFYYDDEYQIFEFWGFYFLNADSIDS